MKIQIDSPLPFARGVLTNYSTRSLAREVRSILHWAARPLGSILCFVAARWRPRIPDAQPRPEQLHLDLDPSSAADLPLRDALPVRSAEYWLQLGQPDQALKELATLPETARRHSWPLRVHLAARHAANTLSA